MILRLGELFLKINEGNEFGRDLPRPRVFSVALVWKCVWFNQEKQTRSINKEAADVLMCA